jgi:hypothetical protein
MEEEVALNSLIINDLQVHPEDHNGIMIASIRPVCLPSISYRRNRTETKSGAKWLRGYFVFFDDLLRL